MGENRVKCFFVESAGKWWIAETEDILGDKDILLIEEKTEEITKNLDKKYVEFIESIAPHIIYLLNDMTCGTDAKGRKVIYPTK